WSDEATGRAELAKVQCGRECPHSVVLVRHRRAEGRVEVAALVADRELHQCPLVATEHPLNCPDARVEAVARVRVVREVDPGKAQEERDCRPELGEELTLSG